MIQIGTELAVVLYSGKKIGSILRAWFFALYRKEYRADPDARLGWLVIIGSVPIVVLGPLFSDAIAHAFRDLRVTATVLIVFGVVLGVADRVGASGCWTS